MIKLVSIDLDGTTLNSTHVLPEINVQALRRAMDFGVKVVVNTGRHYTAAKTVALAIGSNMPLISNNGARVTDISCDRLLYSSPMTKIQVQQVAAECHRQGWPCAASLNSTIYTDVLPAVAKKWQEEGYPIEIRLTGADFYNGDQNADSMMIIMQAPEIYRAQDYLRGRFGEELHIAVSMPPCMDVMSIAAGKGKTLLWLADKYKIDSREIMAIGDSFNDVDMLNVAGIAVAVGNAHPSLKEYADYIAPDNESGGVAAAIEKYIFGEKL